MFRRVAVCLVKKTKASPGSAARALAKSKKILQEAAQLEADEHAVSALATSPATAASGVRSQQRQQQQQQQRSASEDATSASGDAGGTTTFDVILSNFYRQTAPFSDLDEVLSGDDADLLATGGPSSSGSSSSSGSGSSKFVPARVLTNRNFGASIACPKKFFLMQNKPEMLPKMSIGEATHLDDSVGFNELARRFDRLQFGSKAVVITERDPEQAAQRTEDTIIEYFNTVHASLGPDSPSLTIHRAVFLAPFGGQAGSETAAHPLRLCARPAVLRYRPKDNQWVIIESLAILDPLATAARTSACLQRLHFTMAAFRFWMTQPHIPITVRKRFLDLDLKDINKENSSGHMLEETARRAAPVDLKRSGIMHIRQFFPGPATLLDCDPQKLVKFVQRTSLEDLLEADCKNSIKNGGVFDISHIQTQPHPVVRSCVKKLRDEQLHTGRYANARSTITLKKKEDEQHLLFERQQQLLEALLMHHTLPLVRAAQEDPAAVAQWSAFAADDEVCGTVTSTVEQLAGLLPSDDGTSQATPKKGRGRGGKGKKKKGAAADDDDDTADVGTASFQHPLLPGYSAFVGSHCSKGDLCPFFVEGRCLPNHVNNPLQAGDNHLFTLPSTSASKKAMWWEEGMRTVRDILYRHKKGTIKLTAPQLRYVKAVVEGRVAINPGEIDSWFEKLSYPVFVIDFEATQFALPPFPKQVAYQSIPFQFSLDVFQHDILTETPKHYDFLHFGRGYSPNEDPRPKCIAELMRIVRAARAEKKAEMEASGELARLEAQAKAADDAGDDDDDDGARGARRKKKKSPRKPPQPTSTEPVMVPATAWDGCFVAHFASFERSCLEKIGQLEEQYKDEIRQFYFLDTMELMKKGFVHPNAHGSNSLKKVLPAVCPEFQYGVFGVEDGSDGGDDGGESSDAQRGDNAMGVFRLWYHQEGGGTIQDINSQPRQPNHLASAIVGGPRTTTPQQERERVWATLRIQLLEYCSLDTKALYEIMRQIWKEREEARAVKPADKSGWMFISPGTREFRID